ncbi:MAG: TetR/AcrR family transcriptional regulator [Clostridiaceae bacterium]
MNKQEVFQKLINEESSTKQRLFYSAVYLFSAKGYSNVGIRELCRSVNIKESAFYNHYGSKQELFNSILEYFTETSGKVVFDEDEIERIVQSGDIRHFFIENMKKFSSITGNPLYHTILQVVFMECYTNNKAYKLAKNNLYYLRKEYTEKVLTRMIKNGSIKDCNVEQITVEYYYGLKGLLDEFLLHEVWNESTEEIRERIVKHIDFFVELLKKE